MESQLSIPIQNEATNRQIHAAVEFITKTLGRMETLEDHTYHYRLGDMSLVWWRDEESSTIYQDFKVLFAGRGITWTLLHDGDWIERLLTFAEDQRRLAEERFRDGEQFRDKLRAGYSVR
jgi:hypothetical protein